MKSDVSKSLFCAEKNESNEREKYFHWCTFTRADGVFTYLSGSVIHTGTSVGLLILITSTTVLVDCVILNV